MFLELVSLLWRCRFADQLARFIGLTIELLRLLQSGPTLLFEFDHAIDVGMRSTTGAVFLNGGDILQNVFSIEHGS